MEMHGTSKVKRIVLHIKLCTSTYTYRVFDMYLGHLKSYCGFVFGATVGP